MSNGIACERAAARARRDFEGRVVWNVNSTARGGGVAELLALTRSLQPRCRSRRALAGDRRRPRLLRGHQAPAQHAPRHARRRRGLTADDDADLPRRPRSDNAESWPRSSRPATWSCSTTRRPPASSSRCRRTARGWCGDATSAPTRRTTWCCAAWSLPAPVCRATPTGSCSRERRSSGRASTARACGVIPPSIDAFTPKNQPLPAGARSRRSCAPPGIHGGPRRRRRRPSPGSTAAQGASTAASSANGSPPLPGERARGGPGVALGPAQGPGRRHAGFAEGIAPSTDAHLVLAGPARAAVADDPEGAAVLEEVDGAARAACPTRLRERVHLLSLPMDDIEENAAIVNALQRRADVVVQKSLAEGFGLTVAEAMWKARPVVASAVGGIQDQIVDGESGAARRAGRPGRLCQRGHRAARGPCTCRVDGPQRARARARRVPRRAPPGAVRRPLRGRADRLALPPLDDPPLARTPWRAPRAAAGARSCPRRARPGSSSASRSPRAHVRRPRAPRPGAASRPALLQQVEDGVEGRRDRV